VLSGLNSDVREPRITPLRRLEKAPDSRILESKASADMWQNLITSRKGTDSQENDSNPSSVVSSVSMSGKRPV